MLAKLCCAVVGLLAVACVNSPIHAAAPNPQAALNQLLEEVWFTELAEFPLFATNAGEHRYNDKLPDMSPAAYERRREQQKSFATKLAAIPVESLDTDDRINYEFLSRMIADNRAELDFGAHLMPITNRSGFHVEFPELAKDVPLETLADYENYLARLAAFGKYVDDHIALMRLGMQKQIVLPDVSVRDYAKIITPQLVDDPRASRLYTPFEKFSAKIPTGDHERLRAQATTAIQQTVVPGFRKFHDFLRDEYLPACRSPIGAAALPQGREFYRHRVRRFTTLDVTPEQVHATGLAEVERIHAEMQTIINELKFNGDFKAFVEHLRTDPKFYPTSAEQLMKEVGYVLKRMDGELPKLFGKLPRTPYGIRPIPDFIAPQTTTAYYSPPSGDGRRAGFYYVNTYNLKSRPLFEVEVLSIHEAVPGHHLQLALQQELTNVPPLRRFSDCTAFIEGWGLYSERLGKEVGFYADPYSDFGRLSFSMWRACRLVVDTGMHYLGWSRQQAIDYMAANTALSMHNITAEVDRYIAWPGQALAYKMGELKISGLRRDCEERLGAKFDIRAFHDTVLEAGAVPLDVLERRVQGWLAQQVSAAN
ncbi:MAG: DUF885 domain-containing protein [Planctomycetaceae bacterium]|nr:DUF885 domain-containing protein [Planctomycetaceae bacterium]